MINNIVLKTVILFVSIYEIILMCLIYQNAGYGDVSTNLIRFILQLTILLLIIEKEKNFLRYLFFGYHLWVSLKIFSKELDTIATLLFTYHIAIGLSTFFYVELDKKIKAIFYN